MFWKKQKTPAEQVKADADAIVQSLGPKWRTFCEMVPFEDDVRLWQRTEAFASPAIAGMMQHYPSTKHAPPGALWMMIFTAVMESGTNSLADVNEAAAQLETKYAGG